MRRFTTDNRTNKKRIGNKGALGHSLIVRWALEHKLVHRWVLGQRLIHRWASKGVLWDTG